MVEMQSYFIYQVFAAPFNNSLIKIKNIQKQIKVIKN